LRSQMKLGAHPASLKCVAVAFWRKGDSRARVVTTFPRFGWGGLPTTSLAPHARPQATADCAALPRCGQLRPGAIPAAATDRLPARRHWDVFGDDRDDSVFERDRLRLRQSAREDRELGPSMWPP